VKEDSLHKNSQTKRYRGVKVAALTCIFAFLLVAGGGCSGAETTESDSAASTQEALGSCSKGTRNSGHTAYATCSGFPNTGTFWVSATCCSGKCWTVRGNTAHLQSGTSVADCGTGVVTESHIVNGPM